LGNWLKIGVLVSICLIPLFIVPAYGQTNGLVEGQWVKYQFTMNISGSDEMVNTFKNGLTGDFEEMISDDLEYLKYEITSVSDGVFTYQTYFKNFNQDERIGLLYQGKLGDGTGVRLVAIPIDLNLGDAVGSGSGFGISKIVDEEKRNYGGKSVQVIKATGTAIQGNVFAEFNLNSQYFFDKETGMLLDFIADGGMDSFMGNVLSVYMQFKAVDFYKPSLGGGCLIATATFGSELAPQVQQLREIRDYSLLQTESGSAFMKSFNQFYYSFSPEIADLERENPVFKEVVKLTITPLLSSLSLLNYVSMDSEVDVLGYGISLILLNVGMYFVLPAILIHRIKKFC